MGKTSAKKRRLQQHASTIRRKKSKRDDKFKHWKDTLAKWELLCASLYNSNGRIRSYEENSMLLLAMKAKLDMLLQYATDNPDLIFDISWTSIDISISQDFKVRKETISQLRKTFAKDGSVLITDATVRGRGSTNYDIAVKVDTNMLESLAKWVDEQHSKGTSITNERVRNWLESKGVTISRRQAARYLDRMGLRWRKARPKKRAVSEYRLEVLEDFLVGLDKYVKLADSGEGIVFVFTDESYVHNTHCHDYSYLPTDTTINRSSSKGRRLCIIHAITKDGPLVERDDTGYPITDLVWKGDTPHPQDRIDGKLTCETLWCSDSNKGDYHNNMTSEIFIKWVTTKLIPVFKRLHPNKKMVLVADNAPYHHKREIGTLSGLKKKELVLLMVQHNVQYIDVPLTPKRMAQFEDDEPENVTDMGDYYRIEFDVEAFSKRTTDPFVPTVSELQVGFAAYLRDNNPAALECKVEKVLKAEGYDVLWTPPYTPDLQPIEIFWAIGKNRVAAKYQAGRSMKETVRQLREGWYGSTDETSTIKAANCFGLFKKAVGMANKKFIPLCPTLTGTIGTLEVTTAPRLGTAAYPIDLIVAEYASEDAIVDDEDVCIVEED